MDEKKQGDEDRKILDAFFKKLFSGICPTHNIKVTEVQHGRCVYAKECGCRLYQGKVGAMAGSK